LELEVELELELELELETSHDDHHSSLLQPFLRVSPYLRFIIV
jgi:hypothetical protein